MERVDMYWALAWMGVGLFSFWCCNWHDEFFDELKKEEKSSKAYWIKGRYWSPVWAKLFFAFCGFAMLPYAFYSLWQIHCVRWEEAKKYLD